MKFQKMTWLAVLLSAGLMGTACGNDDDNGEDPVADAGDTGTNGDAETNTDTDPDVTEDTGTVSGTFHFGGDIDVRLRIGIFSVNPSIDPATAPGFLVALLSADDSSNDFAFQSEPLPPGEYWVLMAHDVAPQSSLLGDEDPRQLFDSDPATFTTYDPIMIVAGEDTEMGTIVMGGGSIAGELTYEGHFDGDALVAVFGEFPPAGPPLAATVISAPFADGSTVEYVLGGIPDGDDGPLFVVAGYDIGADNIAATELSAIYGPLTFDTDQRVYTDIDMLFPDGVATVSGTVAYAGEEDGVLTVGLFSAFPPPAGEIPVAYEQWDATSDSFPVDFEFEYVPRGGFALAALYDVDADSDGPEVFAVAPVLLDDDNLEVEQGLVLPGGSSTIAGTLTYDVHMAGEVTIAAFVNFPPADGELPVANYSQSIEAGEGTLDYMLQRIDAGTYTVVGLFDFLGDDINPGPEAFGLSMTSPVVIAENGDEVVDEDIMLSAGPGMINGTVEVLANDGAAGVFMVAAYEGQPSPDADPVAVAGPFELLADSAIAQYDFDLTFLPEGDYTVVAAFDGSGEMDFDPQRVWQSGMVSLTADDASAETTINVALGSGHVDATASYYGAIETGVIIYGLFPVGNDGHPNFDAPIYGDFDFIDALSDEMPGIFDFSMFHVPYATAVPFAGIDADGDFNIEAMGLGEAITIEAGGDMFSDVSIDIYDPSQAYCATMLVVCDGTFDDETACGTFVGALDMGNAGDVVGDGATQNCFLGLALNAKAQFGTADAITMASLCSGAGAESTFCADGI